MSLSIGENIKIMRRKCGFTQEELANRIGVTPQAVSKWENEGGLPDLSLIVPLAQIFGITTDSLLGVVASVYGKAHTDAALAHEKLLMETAQSAAEKHLAAYAYFRTESDKEPTNYYLMLKCISNGAEISRYTDFNGFLSDRPGERDEIFADCEKKLSVITRYCEERQIIESANFTMSWIYIHCKEFGKARALIAKLPSLESNNLQESILAQLINLQYGFEKQKEYIAENIRRVLNVARKDFYYSLEDHAWAEEPDAAAEFGEKVLHIIGAYRVFDHLLPEVYKGENNLLPFLAKSRTRQGKPELAAACVKRIADNTAAYFGLCKALTDDDKRKHGEQEYAKMKAFDAEEAKNYAYGLFDKCLSLAEDGQREPLKACADYALAQALIDQLN
ncbi:MAG: helix-turn-helix transcriptional regulator [Oscillospiraceae bacterium]